MNVLVAERSDRSTLISRIKVPWIRICVVLFLLTSAFIVSSVSEGGYGGRPRPSVQQVLAMELPPWVAWALVTPLAIIILQRIGTLRRNTLAGVGIYILAAIPLFLLM